ncbi:ABC transporter substrate-binding protein [Egicoccus halophilus]|uniref:ABC transporter substrate-binding protein n=1 Tax=Egicoccus halophilus TaxID=1670830 RepID=A0A8J3A858_9ACTN|nr:ABC transporter substrate-binding protein [Egicoccus halophilus]
MLALCLAACVGGEPTPPVAGDTDPAADTTATVYPLTVDNCGVEVSFEAPPERVVLLNSAPVAALAALDVLDRVVARAGAFPEEYYTDEVNAAIAGIDSIGEGLDTSGHLQISQEAVLAARPDLVLGLPDGMTREGLAAADVPLIIEPAMCPQGLDAPTFADIEAQVATYGGIFDRREAAADTVASLRQRVADATVSAGGAVDGQRTAAVLYPTVGGGTGYAYGNRSMAHPQLEAAGFANVFGDVDERVFEVTLEEVLDRDPQILVLLHVDGEPGPVEQAVVDLPGADTLTAIRNGDVLVQLFNFTEPPTPLSVDGLERIVDAFGDRR